MSDDILGDYVAADSAPPGERGLTVPVGKAKPGVADPDDILGTYVAQDTAAAPQPVAPIAAAPQIPQPVGLLTNSPTDGDMSSLGKNVATGLIRGVGDAAGTVGNTASLADYIAARGASAVTGKPVDAALSNVQQANAAYNTPSPNDSWVKKISNLIPDPRSVFPNGQQAAAPILAQTGQYTPKTETERMVQGGAEAITGAMGPGTVGAAAPVAGIAGGMLANAPMVAGSSAVGTYAADKSGDPLLGLAAALAPGAAMGTGSALGRRLVGSVDPETAQLAQTARDQFNIPINATQISDSPAMRFGASAIGKLPFSGAGAVQEAQHSAFNRAVSNTFGEDAERITPQVMQAARQRLGQNYEQFETQTTMRPDQQLHADLSQTLQDARGSLTDDQMRTLSTHVQNIADTMQRNGGVIPGTAYQGLKKSGSALDTATQSNDRGIATYANQIKTALRNNMERSATPENAQLLRDTDLQYKNMKTIEPLVEKSTTGNLSPPLLMGAVRGSYNNMAYNGGGDIGDLARIGQRFMKEPPSSGTSERLGAIGALSKVGGLVGGGAVLGNSVSPGAALAGAGSLVATPILGRAIGTGLRSEALARSLIGNSLNPNRGNTNQALVNSLLLPYVNQAGGTVARR